MHAGLNSIFLFSRPAALTLWIYGSARSVCVSWVLFVSCSKTGALSKPPTSEKGKTEFKKIAVDWFIHVVVPAGDNYGAI